jgi:hypothetical protein
MNHIAQELHLTGFGIANLLPTQITVGMREVDIKRNRWREKNRDETVNYLKTNQIPVILGPGAGHYIIDRHHLLLALHKEGVREVPVSIVANMSGFSFDESWTALESRNWTHPLDDEGRRCSYDDMPASVNGLIDDPFRSLAGAIKRAGGYAKDKSPFSEFRWADFLRQRIARELIERDFGRALAVAMDLAQTTEAIALPGWRRRSCECRGVSKKEFDRLLGDRATR